MALRLLSSLVTKATTLIRLHYVLLVTMLLISHFSIGHVAPLHAFVLSDSFTGHRAPLKALLCL